MGYLENYKEACNGLQAFVHVIPYRYIYMQFSETQDCWDWTVYDENKNELEGGQYDYVGIENAYDALYRFIEEDGADYGIEDVDIDDETQVEFLDVDDYYEEF